MKHLMLMNPPRRKKRTKAKARKITRRASPKRRIRRKSRKTVAVAAPVKRRIKRNTKRIMSKKRTSSRSGRRSGRRSNRRKSVGGTFQSMLNKDFLMMGAGAVAAPVVTNVLLSRLPLPGVGTTAAPNKMGLTAYSVGVPMIAAYLLRNKAPSFSQGLVVGAIASGITYLFGSVIDTATSKLTGTTGTSAYLRRPGAYVGKTGAYIGNRTVGRVGNTPPGYSAVQQLSSAPGIFKTDAWKQ